MPEKHRGEGLEAERLSRRAAASPEIAQPQSEAPSNILSRDTLSRDTLEEELRHAQQQIIKLQRLNQTLARSAQKSEQHQQRQETILSLLHESGSDALLRVGKEGKIRSASAAALALLGTDPSYLEGRSFADLTPAPERASLRGYLHEVLRSDKVESTRLKLGVGKYQEFECFFRSVPHPQTQSPELIVLARSVSTLPVKEEAIGELGARLAHELSQPLTAIGTTSRVCMRRLRELLGPEHEITLATEQLAEQSERANELIRRLRQLSTGAAPHRSSVDLNQLIEETVTSLSGQIRQAQVPVVLDLATDLPLVQADRVQLGQVVLNLIRNALEAMAETPVSQRQLTLRTRRAAAEGEVSVADTGPGIAANSAEKLFQPYHTTKPHGMGLGLALCRSILQAHEGRLWVKGNQPRGAVFSFALPINS